MKIPLFICFRYALISLLSMNKFCYYMFMYRNSYTVNKKDAGQTVRTYRLVHVFALNVRMQWAQVLTYRGQYYTNNIGPNKLARGRLGRHCQAALIGFHSTSHIVSIQSVSRLCINFAILRTYTYRIGHMLHPYALLIESFIIVCGEGRLLV